MKKREALRQYSAYAGAVFIRAGLFYYIARVTTPLEFVLYNTYIYYSDIFSTLAGCGTLTAFSFKGGSEKRLASAIAFESLFLLGLFFLYWIKSFFGARNVEMSLVLLFILTFLKTMNLLFSRFYVAYRSISLATVNDLLGNFLWIPLVYLAKLVGADFGMQGYLLMWICTLGAVQIYNLSTLRSVMEWSDPWAKLRWYWSVYLKSFHFTLIGKMYGSFEKILVLHKFGVSTTSSSYMMACKVTGLAAEMSGGFAQSLALNRVGKYRDCEKTERRYISRFVILNVAMMVAVFVGVWAGADIVYELLKTQLVQAHFSLIFWSIPLSLLIQVHGIMGVYLQKQGQLRFLFMTSICMLAVLAVLFALKVSIYQMVWLQTGAFVLLVLADFAVYNLGQSRAKS